MKHFIAALVCLGLTAGVAIASATSADARVVHKCRINGVWHMGECPSVLNGRPTHINCLTWNDPHAFRHAGRCKTAG
jgi:hypothetical protein